VEQVDNPAAPVHRLRLPPGAELRATARPDLLGGIVTIESDADIADVGDWRGALYRPAPAATAPTRISAVPYYIWNNRGPNQMLVWLPEG
jgi:DUF1680 family protein